MIAHQAAYLCLHSLADFAAASDHATRSLQLAKQLNAPRFVAESLGFSAELNRLKGDRVGAQSDIRDALGIARKTGMAYWGPIILGIAALIAEDSDQRNELLCEADTLLIAGAVSHNHILFRKDAIEVCLAMGDWGRSDRYATELEIYTRAEPLPLTEYFLARGRILSTIRREKSRGDLRPEVDRLIEEGERLGYLIALPALRLAAEELAHHDRAADDTANIPA
jgi:hypothetical protein